MKRCKWFKEFGTAAFDPDYMRARIFFGKLIFEDPDIWTLKNRQMRYMLPRHRRVIDDPRNQLCLAEWLLGVPMTYRVAVDGFIEGIESRILFETAKPEAIETFVNAFQEWLEAQVRDQKFLRT